MIEKWEHCPQCDESGIDWAYDGQTCGSCGYGKFQRIVSVEDTQRMMAERRGECPKCGYPGPATNDDALWLRYRLMSEKNKAAFRKMAEALMECSE